jgi:DNA topoisomerase-1
MERIQNNNEKRENILIEAVNHLKPVLAELKKREAMIGEALSSSLKKAHMQERIIGECPNCHTGKLVIVFSRRTKKRFIGCTNFFKKTCQTSFPLPQRGAVKPTSRLCKSCGWPLLSVRIHGNRSWNLCFNPACPKKEEKRKHLEMQSL